MKKIIDYWRTLPSLFRQARLYALRTLTQRTGRIAGEGAWRKDIAVFFHETATRLVKGEWYTWRGLIVIFIAATALGIGIKAIATRTITIGFDDYRLASRESVYDIGALQSQLIASGQGSGRDEVPPKICTE